MPLFTLFRILFSLFLLYFAWPYIPEATTPQEKIFWGAWLVFFLLVIGANLATLFRLTPEPMMEQDHSKHHQSRMRKRP